MNFVGVEDTCAIPRDQLIAAVATVGRALSVCTMHTWLKQKTCCFHSPKGQGIPKPS